MPFLYFDCASGISGDMTLGALIDAGASLETIQAGLASLGLPEIRLSTAEVKKKGFRALQLTIEHPPEHAHRHLHHITEMIERSSVITQRAKELAIAIFTKIGEAEAKVHGTTIRKVHFHEVGAIDSIADIVGVAIAIDLLNITAAAASHVPTGNGFIEIAHGRCSIPAPATAELLAGIPIAPSNVEAELTTPTGAAILATLCKSFGPKPAMTVNKIGYGSGMRDLEQQANILRVMVGETVDAEPFGAQSSDARYWNHPDSVWIMETNLDDVTGEVLGYAQQKLLDEGALDVYVTPVLMKKNRPAVVLTVTCREGDCELLESVMIRETGTLGVRRWPAHRRIVPRQNATVETEWGPIKGVISTIPNESPTFSPEFEECKRVAEKSNVPLRVVMEAATRAFGK